MNNVMIMIVTFRIESYLFTSMLEITITSRTLLELI